MIACQLLVCEREIARRTPHAETTNAVILTGLCKDGKPFFVCTWSPVRGTALEFYGRLRQFHDEYWKHQWSNDHADLVSKLYERKYYNQAWLQPPHCLNDRLKAMNKPTKLPLRKIEQVCLL